MHYLLFTATALIWGSGFFMMKTAGHTFGPISVAAGSTMGGAIVLWSFWLIKRTPWHINSRQLLPILVVSCLGYLIPFTTGAFLVVEIGHGFIGTIISLVPVLTILVSIPLLGVYPSRKQLMGVLVGMGCIGLMVFDGLERDAAPLYLALAMSLPLCYSISNTMVQKYFMDLPPVVMAAMFMTVSTVMLAPFALVMETVVVDEQFFIAVGAIVLLSVFARGVAMLMFYRMIQDKGPLFAGMVTYVIPMEALMWSWLDNEQVTWMQITAIAIVLLMVGIVQRDIVRRSNI